MHLLWQLDEAKRTRGERVDDGTAQRDRPLFEVCSFFKKNNNNNANVPLSILFFGLIKNIVELYGVADSSFSFM